MSKPLPARYQLGEVVSVISRKPVRDFTGPVVGVHFKNDGIVYFDVRDAGGNIIEHIDQLQVFPINHHRAPARATRAQKERTA
jgi:hypothetical protein